MKPLFAFSAIAALLVSVLASLWLSSSTPSNPALLWVVLQLKPTLAVAWLLIALLLLCTFVHYTFLTRRDGAIVLPQAPEADVPSNPTSSSNPPADEINYCAAFLQFALMCDAGITSFTLFKHGVPWAHTDTTLDNLIAFALFFLHGLGSCSFLYAVLNLLRSGVKYVRGTTAPDGTLNEEGNIVDAEK
ncbi:hypothetical protein MVEN_00812800 [Mycena venus]|uniref:Uncharacterized protein n=1 Tax=Mycena venus TaxID=2733690 RepID=A0A8H7D6N6_9AGAR|nr:hypothetical protein MVEN_00812800 [Mycena venus]